MWQQTIKAKLQNQVNVLDAWNIKSNYIKHLVPKVLSGDSDNKEAQAAKYYWSTLYLEEEPMFVRERFGDYPNNFFLTCPTLI